jgi:hypothetical protein
LTSTPTGRRLALALPLTLAIAALLMLLAIPGQALAKGASCTTAHAKRDAHTCAQARSKAKKHHGKHATKKKAKKKKKAAKKKFVVSPPAAVSEVKPVCEDGSTPVSLGGGSYSCDDESEPACENGSEPALSAGSGTLVCPALPEGGAGTIEPVCEDGSAPVRSAAGSYSCDDESEAECENGETPVLSSAGALTCPAAPDNAEAASEFDSDGLLGTIVSATRPALEP